MNFKKQAAKLESYLTEEFQKELPIALMPDGSIVYKNYKIKQTKQKTWKLYRIGGNMIDSFNLKACALMGAKLYSINRLSSYNEVKNLDQSYQKNATDAAIFKYRYDTVTDPVRKDTVLWRWELSNARANSYKQQISHKFKSMF